MYLCAEWEAEKGGRMGCLMKEKIQGLAERKAFILLFVIVWELCSSSGNLTYREIIARPAFVVNLHTAMVCMFPPPPFPPPPANIRSHSLREHSFTHWVGKDKIS